MRYGYRRIHVLLNASGFGKDLPPVTIMTPEALQLACAPVADCTRYDSLRRAM